jgi:hypothetical protein
MSFIKSRIGQLTSAMLLLLVLFPVTCLAQCADSCACDTDPSKYAFETTFSGSGINVSSIAFEKILNERSGFLLNFDFGIEDSDQNTETISMRSDSLETLTIDSDDRITKSYELSILYMYKLASKKNIDIILGFGPGIEYQSISRDEKVDRDDHYYRYEDRSSNDWNYGAQVMLYIEWNFTHNVSLFARAGLSYYYQSGKDEYDYTTNDVPYSYTPSSNGESSGYALKKETNRLGIRMYF